MADILKLGTRQSLLAMAQSRAVASAIKRHHPELTVELVGIETRGDRDLRSPLSEIEGKEFFVAELDQALLSGAVDLTVHSLKDLSLERPAALTLAAVPPRENPRDVALFSAAILARLSAGQPIRMGTSSPRRIENIAPFLSRALPALNQSAEPPRIATNPIRGNVDTRLRKLFLPDDAPEKIDGVVLALAGLNRLWADPDGRAALEPLLPQLRWMLLPLAEYPTAPGQAALAIECRADDDRTQQRLKSLHCERTRQQVQAERAVLEGQGGGCHQSFGATRVDVDDLGELLFVRGKLADGSDAAECRWNGGGGPMPEPRWDGTHWRSDTFLQRAVTDSPAPDWAGQPGATFIAHSRALPAGWCAAFRDNPAQRIWTAGTKSWFRLARQGIWVEGCAEQFGFAALEPTLEQGVFGLPALADWQILTHRDAQDAWPEQAVTVTYEVNPIEPLHANHAAVVALRQARSAFWTSGSQFAAFRAWLPENCRHACRYGRTYFYLREQGLDDLTVFPSVDAWRRQAT